MVPKTNAKDSLEMLNRLGGGGFAGRLVQQRGSLRVFGVLLHHSWCSRFQRLAMTLKTLRPRPVTSPKTLEDLYSAIAGGLVADGAQR
jgi:hypothetical protein